MKMKPKSSNKGVNKSGNKHQLKLKFNFSRVLQCDLHNQKIKVKYNFNGLHHLPSTDFQTELEKNIQEKVKTIVSNGVISQHSFTNNPNLIGLKYIWEASKSIGRQDDDIDEIPENLREKSAKLRSNTAEVLEFLAEIRDMYGHLIFSLVEEGKDIFQELSNPECVKDMYRIVNYVFDYIFTCFKIFITFFHHFLIKNLWKKRTTTRTLVTNHLKLRKKKPS